MRRLTALGSVFFFIVSLSAQATHDASAVERQSSDTAFAELRRLWAHDLHDKKIDECMAAYAPDGEFIQPDGARVRGSGALRKLFETVTTTFDSDLVFDSQRVETSGNLAYDSGTYRETLVVRDSGKRQSSSGSYLTIYRRERNGSWLIVEQAWTGTVQ